MAVSARLPSLWLLVHIAAASVAAAGLVTPALSAPGTTAGSLPLVTANRTASCGGCKGWLQHMRANGFQVRDVVVADLAAIS